MNTESKQHKTTDRDYFTADLHLGHAGIMKHSARTEFMTDEDRAEFERRQRDGGLASWKPSSASLRRMDHGLIANINAVVPKDARLWILGDFAMTRDETQMRKYRHAIDCRDIRIVWGNHDRRDVARPHFTGCYEAVMLHIGPERTITEDEMWGDPSLRKSLAASSRRTTRRVFLSHYAHAVWHHSHRGVFHLYGHSHGNFEPWREANMPNALSMDVGVDCWGYLPLPWSRMRAMLEEKEARMPPHIVDHHGGR